MNNNNNNVNIYFSRIKKLASSLSSIPPTTGLISLSLSGRQDILSAEKRLEKCNSEFAMRVIERLGHLKVSSNTLPNGLILFCGKTHGPNGSVPLLIDFPPESPTDFSFTCATKFDVSILKKQMAQKKDDTTGFIVIDPTQCLLGTVSGNSRQTLLKISSDVPKKRSQETPSSQKVREVKKQEFLHKINEAIKRIFYLKDGPFVTSVVIAGTNNLRERLKEVLDSRLKVSGVIEVTYGGENGFNQAIELSQASLGNLKYNQERKVISRFFDEIARDTGNTCYGLDYVIYALTNIGNVEIVILWEEFSAYRYVLQHPINKEIHTLFLTADQVKNNQNKYFVEPIDKMELVVLEQVDVLEWFSENCSKFGAQLEVISNKSDEGFQFVTGFGGLGAITRYQSDFSELEQTNQIDDEEENCDDLIRQIDLSDIEFF